MLRIFTKDVGKNFKKGEQKDYTQNIWEQISKSAQMPLEKFTAPLADAAIKGVEASVPRKVRKSLMGKEDETT